MSDDLRSVLPSMAILGVVAAFALFLTLTRDWADSRSERVRGAARAAMVTLLSQAAHFVEELATGFHERFPALFGVVPMSLPFFVSFNVAWLAIWGLCAWGLPARRRATLFPLWFLGIACAANGVAHPSFSLLAGGYFPGLATSPLVGLTGVVLLRRLGSITQPRSEPPPPLQPSVVAR